jgi:membrane protein
MTMLSSLWQFIRDLFKATMKDDCLRSATLMAYNVMMSIPAVIIFLVSVFASMGIDQAMNEDTIRFIYLFSPPEMADTLKDLWHNLRESSNGGITIISMLGVLITVSNGAVVVLQALDRAYADYYGEAKQLYWYHRLFAVGFILMIGLLMVLGTNLAIFGDVVIQWVHNWLNLPIDTIRTVQIVRWSMVCLGILLFSSSIYALVPWLRKIPVKPQRIVPGALFFLLGWGALSWLFKYYVENFGNYSVYGALGVFIIVMIWLQLSSLILLIGGEVNALLMCPNKPDDPTPQASDKNAPARPTA